VTLREYQLLAVAGLLQHHRPLLVAPTGSGKTVIAGEIIRRSENQMILWLTHRPA
jgi:superfamily II DNA or RNA helicase